MCERLEVSEALRQLEREFIRIEELADFLGVSVGWLKEKAGEGLITLKQVGRGNYFAYVPEILEAIRENMLAPNVGKESDEAKRSMEKRNPLGSISKRRKGMGSQGKGKGQRSLQNILREEPGQALG